MSSPPQRTGREKIGEIEVLDGREIALLVVVDKLGVATVRANGVGHKQAAEWMRKLADSWDPQAVVFRSTCDTPGCPCHTQGHGNVTEPGEQ